MRARGAVWLLLSALQAAAQGHSAPGPPALLLRGDTRVCHGFLQLSHRHLIWKSSFATCDSDFRVAGAQEGTWTLELTGRAGSRSRGCTLGAVTLEQSGPATDYAVWQLAGYRTLAGSRTQPPTPEISCELQSDQAGPARSRR